MKKIVTDHATRKMPCDSSTNELRHKSCDFLNLYRLKLF